MVIDTCKYASSCQSQRAYGPTRRTPCPICATSKSIVRRHLVPAFGHLPLANLDPSSVQRWVNETAARDGSAAVDTQVPILRAALASAVRRRMVPHNVATMVDLPSHAAKRMTFLEPDELRALLEHEDREWARDAVLGLAFTGARFSELAALTPADVNLLHSTIDIYATKTKTHRTIAIAGPLRPVLERRLAAGHERVFTTDSGAVLRAPNFRSRVWYPLCARAGVSDVRVHDLRHTCASWLIGSGANPVQVCAWLGHSKPTQTLDTYAHIFRTDMESLADSLDRMWATSECGENVVPTLRAGGAS
ncbi:MAG: tyrosine-type recombinase/integrase [Actinomycetes bacterium]